MKFIYALLIAFLMISCKGISQEQQDNPKKEYAIVKSDAEWKAELPQMAYYVLRKAGTERAFSGPLNYNKEAGTYVCAKRLNMFLRGITLGIHHMNHK